MLRINEELDYPGIFCFAIQALRIVFGSTTNNKLRISLETFLNVE